jgi:FkbM family methyltransferase
MKLPIKKVARSIQVLAPGLQEVRYTLSRRALELSGRTWRSDANALRYFRIETPVIVDIGANRGFSISGFQTLKKNARIIAFEPLSSLADVLRSRYENRADVTIHCCALGSDDAEMTIYIPVYRGFVFDPLASLDYDQAANWINSSRFYFFDANKLKIREEHVKVRRLDDFAIEPDVIKIYAQGHEPSIVQGARATILRYEPAIIAPARIPQTDSCLRELGYARYGFQDAMLNSELEGRTMSWYLRPKHLDMFSCGTANAAS